MNPFLSVVIPLYNKESCIRKTIRSVIHQSYSNFEIIIVNDGSTDNSVEEVKKINDNRIKLLNQENQGVSAARNSGILQSRGSWILFLDADDILLPEALYILVNNIIDQTTIVAANFIIRSAKEQTKFLHNKKSKLYKGKEIYNGIATKNLFLRTGSFIMPTNIATKVLFNENYHRFEDLDFFLRCFNFLDILLLPDIVMAYETSFAHASKINKDNWEGDFLSYLPFSKNSFWQNCALGEFGYYAINSYPNRTKELKTQYKPYLFYIGLSRLFYYLDKIKHGFIKRIIRKVRKKIKI